VDKINTYLWFAYLPPKVLPGWLDSCVTRENKGLTYTPEEVTIRFNILFDKLVSENLGERHIIPLSGGWDSRAILGALLERLSTNEIETVTFGVPGQLDYDIGLKVSRWAGVKSHPIDLRTLNFTWNSIIESVKKSPWTYVPDVFFNQYSLNYLAEAQNIIWSGFLGDLINGGHARSKRNHTDQIKNFIDKERRLKLFSLVKEDFDPYSLLKMPSTNCNISIEDALMLGYHCTNCTTPINLPTGKWDDWSSKIVSRDKKLNFVTPFIDMNWAGYWLQAPDSARLQQKLFFNFFSKKFDELYKLPSKSNLGQSSNKVLYLIKRLNHGLSKRIKHRLPIFHFLANSTKNYVDYDEMFRSRKDYQETLITAFDYLKKNQIVPWLNLDKLWNEHMKRRKNHGEAFQILLGLAANLNVEDQYSK